MLDLIDRYEQYIKSFRVFYMNKKVNYFVLKLNCGLKMDQEFSLKNTFSKAVNENMHTTGRIRLGI